ncbi:nuclear transport factor 2 family protein [Isoptericola sp. b408]|uniref:nuclear transport factor 2 family protein n=1 Tax=Isoptericola sp. b408 TaxID=3064653 RepID=UPI002712940A|nr:nuclear transport factor 2 family protein [Isoptericola sp. b408]MDO8152122.1 nuclear transport factor 2 family protein [Isoptericola sp. b408]
MTSHDSPQPLDHVLDLERELQTPACRADETRLRELLAADFVEIGASGRRWDLDSILTMLHDESAEGDAAVIRLTSLTGRVLAPGVVQVFWESDQAGRRARRTSIWCERAGRWQQVSHQGTPVP